MSVLAIGNRFSMDILDIVILVLVHTERLRQRSATKMGYIGCLLDVLHGATVTANCDCDILVLQIWSQSMGPVPILCDRYLRHPTDTLHTPYDTHCRWFNRSRSRTVWTSTYCSGYVPITCSVWMSSILTANFVTFINLLWYLSF